MSRANDVIPNVDKLQRVGVCSETKTNTLGAYSGPQLLYPSHSSVPLLGCSSLERSQIVSARARHRCGFLRVSPQRQFDMSRHQDHKHTSSGQCRRAHAGPSSPNLARAGIYNVHLQSCQRQRTRKERQYVSEWFNSSPLAMASCLWSASSSTSENSFVTVVYATSLPILSPDDSLFQTLYFSRSRTVLSPDSFVRKVNVTSGGHVGLPTPIGIPPLRG